jgi:threonine dehydrogenase-like Zn-dependent dehydrogenase
VNRCAVDVDSRVAVLGVGPIGLGAVIWMKHRGVGSVVAVDLSEARLERALAFGADAAINAGNGDLGEQLAAIHGPGRRGVTATDVFLDAAGSPAALADVVRIAPFGARITVVAVYKAPASVDLSAMLHKEMSLVTSVAYPTELEEVVAFLGDNADRMGAFITSTFDITEFDQAVAQARTSNGGKVMVRVSN